MVDATSPQQQLMVHAARRYYVDDASKIAIADEMGISRFKVARLLEDARTSGIVRIEIVDPSAGREQLAEQLRSALGVEYVVVVDTEDADPESQLDAVGRQAADLLRKLAQPTDVIGLPWSRMVARSVRFFDGLPPVPIVQLSGALDLPAYEASPVDVVRDAARLTGGEPRVFYAPLVADDADAARVIRAQASVAGTLDEAKHCSLALVGVGGWSQGQSTLFDLATESERGELARLDVVGEIAGSLFDASGSPVSAGLTGRLVSMSPQDLKLITHVVAVSHGRERAAAVCAGIRGGYITSIVVDVPLAQALLELAQEQHADPAATSTHG